MENPAKLKKKLKMALLKIESFKQKLCQKMRTYPYCQLQYICWRSFCQHFLIFICTHQAHSENFSNHQNLAKNRLFHFAGHMLCHIYVQQKNFLKVFQIDIISLSISILVGQNTLSAAIDPSEAQKCQKNDLKKNFI